MNKTETNILDSSLFKRVMYFKLFMVIFVWGLIPLLIPIYLIHLLGLRLDILQIIFLRFWGALVLIGALVYLYILKNPHGELSKYLLLFAVIDNGGLGILLLLYWLIFGLPWSIYINIPFQLFFGYYFLRFYKEGTFDI